MNNYWVVGAMLGGRDDVFDTFVKRGYWYCWEPNTSTNEEPSIARQQEKVRQISVGDRIAIKKMLGQGAANIEIRSIGIVTDIDFEEWRIYVKWIEIYGEGNLRYAPLNGAAASIHGPYKYDDPWTRAVFCV